MCLWLEDKAYSLGKTSSSMPDVDVGDAHANLGIHGLGNGGADLLGELGERVAKEHDETNGDGDGVAVDDAGTRRHSSWAGAWRSAWR